MIEIRQLTRRFGPILAVDAVSLRVEKGEVLGFLGPNGAGKSTTMKMVSGFLPPTGGTALVCGHDVLRDPIAVKRSLGYLPEGAPAYPDMTPESFLRFVAEVRGYRGAERRRRVGEVAARVHLEGVMRQPIETLSKGYKRRVGLAQALLHDPLALILDEPTDGLDPNQKHEVRELIRDLRGHKAVVLSTHILEEVNAVCTRATIIARGRIVADGSPEDLRRRSRLHNAVRVRARCAADGLEADLARIAGVSGVEQTAGGDGVYEALVLARDGASILAGVSDLLRARGVTIDALSVEPGRLDDVFREITAGSAGEAA